MFMDLFSSWGGMIGAIAALILAAALVIGPLLMLGLFFAPIFGLGIGPYAKAAQGKTWSERRKQWLLHRERERMKRHS